MNPSTTEKISHMCPNIKLAKKLIARMYVRKSKKRLISENETKCGENNETEKKRIVDKYVANGKKLLSDTIRMADQILDHNSDLYANDTERENIRTDMIFNRLAYGFYPDEYVCFGLANQTPEEKREWISDLDFRIAVHRMNNIKDRDLFDNKTNAWTHFSKYYKRDHVCIKTKSDYEQFQAFITKHPVFVKKEVLQCRGNGVELIDIRTIGVNPKEYFLQLIHRCEHVLEEPIEQDESMMKINPSSVNTVRMITFLTHSGIVGAWTFLRCGQSGSFVDNGAAGGIMIGINNNTGVLETDGFDEDNHLYRQHPDTGLVFRGYQLPEWDQLVSICKEIAESVPQLPYLAFDMSYTPKGWCVVEINVRGQMSGRQIVYHKGGKKELETIMSNMDLIL